MSFPFLPPEPPISATPELQALIAASGEPWNEDHARLHLHRLRLAPDLDRRQWKQCAELGRAWAQQANLRAFVLLASFFPRPMPSSDPKLGDSQALRSISALLDAALRSISVLVGAAIESAIDRDDVTLLDLLLSPALSQAGRGPWVSHMVEAALAPRPPERVLAFLARQWANVLPAQREEPYWSLVQQGENPQVTFAGLAVLQKWLPSAWGKERGAAQALIFNVVVEDNWKMEQAIKAWNHRTPVAELLPLLHDLGTQVNKPGPEVMPRLWALTDLLLEQAENDLQLQWLADHADRLPRTVDRRRAAARLAGLSERPAPRASPRTRARS